MDRDRVFFSSPSPGTLAVFFGNQYYASHKDFVHALGLAMKEESASARVYTKWDVWLAKRNSTGAYRFEGNQLAVSVLII